MNITEAKNYVCEWGKKMAEAGIVSETSCLSCRVENDMVITPDGAKAGTLSAEDLVIVNVNDLSIAGDKKPSQEYKLHAAVYIKRKDFKALIHSNQVSITTSSKAGIEVTPLLDDMAQIVGVSAKVAKYKLPVDDKSIKSVIKALKGRSAALLEDNGAICGAGNFDDAYAVAQVLEKGCKAFIESTFLGGGIKIIKPEAMLMRFVYLLKYSKADETNK